MVRAGFCTTTDKEKGMDQHQNKQDEVVQEPPRFPTASNGNMVGLSREHHGTYEVRREIFLQKQQEEERPEPHASGETE